MHELEFEFNAEGELVITRGKGDKLVLTQDVLEEIWEETEYRKTMEHLMESEEVQEDKSLLKDIERLTEYYIAERDALVEANESMLIRLSITDVDMDEDDYYEEAVEEFEVNL